MAFEKAAGHHQTGLKASVAELPWQASQAFRDESGASLANPQADASGF
ncbi:hypothetical protein IFR09_05910 [Pseudomonas syringae]|nr:hypothetical protein [Pseudomonas syringae]MBD8800291.1 hypothetical protein [Pseudomonas syringae]MBD8810693.1 hypothetical protein [Pseudomonas syringae]